MSPSGEGGNARACAFIEVAPAAAGGSEFYGAGVDTNIVTASLRAVITGINRLQSSVPRRSQKEAA
jgi:2-isopropylmalate synthase